MKFNPNDYETVKSRKRRFYEKYPDGRIVVEILNLDTIRDAALIMAKCYIDGKDIPKSTGLALEIRDKELKVSSKGTKYESVNYTSWVENAEESAIGRALDNAGFSGDLKASREEMQKAQRHSIQFGGQ